MALLFMMAVVLLPDGAVADSINGFMDLTWSNASTKTTDASGQSTKTEVNSYFQRYNLQIDKTLYPKLRFDMAGVYEKDTSNIKGDTPETNSTNTRFRPWMTLTLTDPLYTAGVGYYLRESKQESSQAPTVTTVGEDYNAILGWKPVGLPSLDVKYTKSYLYDRDRVIQDIAKDNVFVASQYTSRGLDLRYFGTYTETDDVLHHQETRDINHSGRGSYANSFLNGRLGFSTSYNITHDETTVSATGTGGTLSTQLFPSAGMSLLSDTPATGALTRFPADRDLLIDSDLVTPTGLNIGLNGGSTRVNIGLEFLSETEVNNLALWVDRELTPEVAASFSWDVYTSSDNFNWTFQRTVFPAPFGPFQNRFDIDFPNVKTKYIKVVVRPLQVTVIGASSFPTIGVTELQAFLKQSVAQGTEQKFTSESQVSNTAVRYRIFNAPLLYYDGSYYYARKDPTGQEITTLSNGFSASHRFTEVLSGTARVAREDGRELEEQRTAYVYNASLTATPLRTLTHSLVFSGRNEAVGEDSRSFLSLFLNNTAQLYRGIDVNLNGGATASSETDGTNLKTTQVTLGANIVPHRTMTVNCYFTDVKTDQTRTTGDTTSTTTKTTNLNVAYNPFPTLYLSAAMQIIDESGQGTKTLQNYGLNWSPFPDGAFQFRFSYQENRRPEDQSSDRIISPGLRYKINNRSFLDVSYQIIQNDSPSQTIESQVITANLKIFL